MRHSAFLVAISALLLSSCSGQGEFSPEEVLNRSSVANSGLLSARILMRTSLSSVDVTTGAMMNGSLNVQGNIQEGGRQLDIAFDTRGEMNTATAPLSWEATGRMTVLSEEESYVLLETLVTDPAAPFPPIPALQNMTGKWLRLPSASNPSATLTPDPRFLRMQSDVVQVTKDRGMDSHKGRRMYHYDVAVDETRLASYLQSITDNDPVATENLLQQLANYTATGEVWIDAETFLLTKAAWMIGQKNDESFELSVSMELSDAGLPVRITAPEAAEPFPLTPLLPAGDAMILQEF